MASACRTNIIKRQLGNKPSGSIYVDPPQPAVTFGCRQGQKGPRVNQPTSANPFNGPAWSIGCIAITHAFQAQHHDPAVELVQCRARSTSNRDPGARYRTSEVLSHKNQANAHRQSQCLRIGATDGTSSSRRHARRHGAIQDTGECTQQLHLRRRGSLIVPGTGDTGLQKLRLGFRSQSIQLAKRLIQVRKPDLVLRQ